MWYKYITTTASVDNIDTRVSNQSDIHDINTANAVK